MKTHELEARPLSAPRFRTYCQMLREAQRHENQVERARLYREAALFMYPESPELRAYHAKAT